MTITAAATALSSMKSSKGSACRAIVGHNRLTVRTATADCGGKGFFVGEAVWHPGVNRFYVTASNDKNLRAMVALLGDAAFTAANLF
jgi:hypothetical protein